MKTRFLLIALVLAASAFALSPDRAEWGKGPVQFLMTKDEAAKWNTIKTDEAADQFVALFWARRDPTPATPRNEFKEQFEQRVAAADKNFKADRKRGALTDRGRIFILHGQPKKMERAGDQRGSAQPLGIGENPDPNADRMAEKVETHIWTYDEDMSRDVFGVPRAALRFTDRFGNSEFKVERGGVDLAKAQQRANERSIKQPNLTEVPRFDGVAAETAVVEAPVEAVPVQTALTTEALATAVAGVKKAKASDKVFAMTGEFVTAEGETFVPVLVYVPKSAGFAAEGNTFFGVVEDASGNSVLAFEEPAKLTASKDDWFVDKSITLPGGKYRGYFGVSGNGKTEITAVDMDLTGKIDKDAVAASQLIISNNVYPLSEAQHATDPFAFGGLKVVPKADRTFTKNDELWYFVELRNPGVPESVPTASTDPAAAPAPKIQVKLEVVSKDASGKEVKRSAPPMEVDAIPIKGVPNHYGVGSSIPLSGFKPGDYTFNVKVIDTISKASYTLSEKFKVVE